MTPQAWSRAWTTAAGAVLFLSLVHGCSCGSPSEAPRPVGGADAATSGGGTTSTSTTTGQGGSAGAGGAGGSATTSAGGGEPCPDWPGWVRWKDFAPDCSFCVPASKAALPAPIEWVPCDVKAKMPNGCRQMKIDWPNNGTGFAYTAAVDVGPDGKAVLDITRNSALGPKPFSMKVIADADGPVHTAFIDPRGYGITGCIFNSDSHASLAQGKYIMEIIDGDVAQPLFPEAAVGGSIDDLSPHVLGSWKATQGHAFTISDMVWATWDSYEVGVAKWGEPWKVVLNGGEVGGLQQHDARAWHDFVTWRSSDGVYVGAMAWTPEKGAYPFLTFPGDWSRGVEGLGTDGIHMVWIYEEGKGPAQEPYPTRSLMVSPFTKDPKALKPKRLRSYPGPEPAVTPFAVGCGYAAIEATTGHILVVRLSDGWSWDFHEGVKAGPDWKFTNAFAVTCDEVFVRGGAGAEMNIARVRLDALGPGMAPD